jgi:hypothetical protein
MHPMDGWSPEIWHEIRAAEKEKEIKKKKKKKKGTNWLASSF